jgi:hypothetical protein
MAHNGRTRLSAWSKAHEDVYDGSPHTLVRYLGAPWASGRNRTMVEPGSRGAESLTQLLARILNQLSVSAWLPAATVVFIVLLYSNLRTHGDDPVQALQAISSLGWGSLILVVGAIVLVTVLTQAFGYEAIQLLEGYWGSGWIGSACVRLGCSWHRYQRGRLDKKLAKARRNAFEHARQALMSLEEFRWAVPILESSMYKYPYPDWATTDQIEKAETVSWQNESRPGDVHRMERLARQRITSYPSDAYRLMPTRLGNILRASEDRYHDPGSGSLEGSIQRVFHLLPSTMQSDHDEIRTRLDLYCTMAFVFLGAALAAVLVLKWSEAAPMAALICLCLAFFSYRAAITSARSYGTMLETIADFTKHQLEKSPELIEID